MMIIFKIYFFISSFFSLFQFSKNYIVLPFNSDKIEKRNIFKENFYQSEIDFFLEKDKHFTLISLGSETIELYLSINYFNFFLGNGLCRNNSLSTYKPVNSKYFKILVENIERVGYIKNVSYCLDNGSLYNDIQLNNNITISNISFLYGLSSFSREVINLNQICGYIGLKIENSDESFKECNFIKILKQNRLISSFTWNILFFNEYINNQSIINQKIINKYEGYLLCGIEEKDYKNIYLTDDVRTVKAKPRYSIIDWGMTFSELYFEDNNDKLNYQSRVQIILEIDLDYIISTKNFFNHITKTVFKKYFEENICFFHEKQKLKGNYIIICNKTFEKYINNFPNLYLYNKEMNYSFILSYKDLFKYYNNRIYFLIINKEYYTDYWIFGKIFLKKYPFVFDYDKKTISFINIYNKKNENINGGISKLKSFFNIIKNISIIIGIIIGILIGKKIWDKNRKKRMNELIDSYQYESFSDKNNKIKKLELKDKHLFENN